MTPTIKVVLFFVILIVASFVSTLVDNMLDIKFEPGNMNAIVHKTMYMVIGGILVYYLFAAGLVGAFR